MSEFINRLMSNTGKDMFITIFKFNIDKSRKIDDALFLKKDFFNCYLSNDGSFVIYKKNITNDISTEKEGTEYINTFTNKPVSINSGLKPLDSQSNQKYFFSPNSKWILYKESINENIIYYILLNTFHFRNFKDYYNITGNESTVLGLFNKYCKEVNNMDNACYCMNFNDNPVCLYDLLGKVDTDKLKNSTDVANKQIYGTLSTNCPCINQKCTIFKTQNADSNTFIPEYIKTQKNNCQGDFILSYCNSAISAGGNLSTSGKVSVNQTCSAQGITIPTDTPASSITPLPPSSTPTSTTPSSTTPSSTTPTSTTPSSTTPSSQGTTNQNFLEKLTNIQKIFIGISIFLLLLIIGLLIYKNSKK